MLYDVFVSYSRKDSKQVDSLISYLRRDIPGIKLWYDREGLETAEEFHDRIIGAIDESRVVIFACSESSMSSTYCKKEVMYAKAIGKTVIPYLLPGMTLKGWLLFEFGNINCICSTHIDQINRMVKDLKRWSGHKGESQSSSQNHGTENLLEAKPSLNANTAEVNLKSNSEAEPTSDSGKMLINGHEYVDLGLPSGLKWATCNLGAWKPEICGEYYAWGETVSKTRYSYKNSLTFRGGNLLIRIGIAKDKNSDKWLKEEGYIDESGNLTPSHDPAHQSWGGSWRMPTKAEIDELLRHTTKKLKEINGIKGVLVNSRINGRSIFLPLAGYMDDQLQKGERTFGYYWSSTPYKVNSWSAYCLRFWDSKTDENLAARYFGCTIRPVSN